MTRWLLARMGYATLDLDAVARALASPVLRDFEPETLDAYSTVQYLRTRYMRLVADVGLPADCCNEVADRAWRIIASARDVPATYAPVLALYD